MMTIRIAAAALSIAAVTAGCSDTPTTPEAMNAQFVTVPAPVGLIHLWSGEGNAHDAVGTAHGTLGYTTSFDAGVNGQAFSFNGFENAIVSLPVNIGPAALPRMTMGMWVNLRRVVNDQGWVIGHDDAGYDRSLALTDWRYRYPWVAGVRGGVAGGTGLDPHVSTLIRLTDHLNSWHCVAVAYDAVTRTAMFYADGATQTVTATPGEGNAKATLGGLASFKDHTVDGLVDEVFMYDRALTGSDIDAVCDATSPPSITRFVIDRATLWPVNNKLVTVASGIAAFDHGDATPDIDVVVTANEPISNGDWAVIRNPDGTVDVQLRATRSGTGTGRVYTVTATATDGTGNRASASGSVSVPHDQGTRAGK